MLWRMHRQAGHLHSNERTSCEHRFMQESGRNMSAQRDTSHSAGSIEHFSHVHSPFSSREQLQCTLESHSVCMLHRPCCVYMCWRGVTVVNAEAAAGQRNQASQSLDEKALGNKGLSVHYSSKLIIKSIDACNCN
jgi:hypothetical protein